VLKSVQHSLFKINGEFEVTPENILLMGQKRSTVLKIEMPEARQTGQAKLTC
jgi:hypothetical protein